MEDLKYVGKSVNREDSYGRATGKTKFICDMKRQNMLYAKLVLSEKPHAKLEIDKSEALKVEGIEAIYTYDDVPKVLYNSHEWYADQNEYHDEYLLCNVAKFVGDRIALVVGTSKKSVEKAISKLHVAYKELDSVIKLKDSKLNKTIINGETNISFSKEISCGNYNEKFKQADYIIKDIGTTPKIHHSAIETHICLCETDEMGSLVIWSPCQIAFKIQYDIAHILNIPFNKVRVIKAAMGGSFGGKGQPILEPVCAFASFKLNRPVMTYMDRKDAILGTRSRAATETCVETAINSEGKILGRKISVDIDGGAYYTNSSAIATTLGKKLFRLYNIKDQYYEGKTYYTNTLPSGACRGYGSPQAHAITEINMDNAAKKIGMDPCEFRLKNLVDENEKDPTGSTDLGNAKIKECVLKGMEAFDWYNKRKNIKSKNNERYAYGVGMSCAVHGNGYKGAHPDFTDVNMGMFSDGSVLVKVGIHEQGCGTVTTMQQIAAEALDMSMDKIRVLEVDTLLSPYDAAGTQASRVTFVCGGAVKSAGEKLKEQLINAFCEIHNCDMENITAVNGTIYNSITGEKSSYAEVVAKAEKKLSKSISVLEKYESPANPASYSVCFAEVKVDKYTGQTEVTDMLAVHDIGKSINPQLVEGQIQGGAHFSIGMALTEEIDVDSKGYVKSTNFSKYHLLNAPQMPEVRVITIEENEPFGPYGAKSVGELSAVAPGPAVINAINFALDTNITTYPATPEVIVKALNN